MVGLDDVVCGKGIKGNLVRVHSVPEYLYETLRAKLRGHIVPNAVLVSQPGEYGMGIAIDLDHPLKHLGDACQGIDRIQLSMEERTIRGPQNSFTIGSSEYAPLQRVQSRLEYTDPLRVAEPVEPRRPFFASLRSITAGLGACRSRGSAQHNFQLGPSAGRMLAYIR